MLAPPRARRLGPGGAATQQGRQRRQQCFLCAGSRAKMRAGAIFIGLRSCTAGALEKRGLLRVRFDPSKPTIVQAKSIVSLVPIADIGESPQPTHRREETARILRTSLYRRPTANSGRWASV